MDLFFDFLKRDDAQRMVYGYCSTEKLDVQGDIVAKDAIKGAWGDYMQFANLREMHKPSAVGVVKDAQFDDRGCYIAAKVVDDAAWTKVCEGVYKGFSIGGKVVEKSGNTINRLRLHEISLVDRPANPEARIEMFKADDPEAEARSLLKALGCEHLLKDEGGAKGPEIDLAKFEGDVLAKAESLVAPVIEKLAATSAALAATEAALADVQKSFPAKLDAIEKASKEKADAFEARIKKLEDEPAAPKGVTRAVAKSDDGKPAAEEAPKSEGHDPQAALREIYNLHTGAAA